MATDEATIDIDEQNTNEDKIEEWRLIGMLRSNISHISKALHM